MKETPETGTGNTGPRRLGREAALQAIYLADLTGRSLADIPETAWIDMQMPPRARAFAKELAIGATDLRADIDAMLQRYAENWELPRMATIDRCVLRLAAYEILREKDTPLSVIINEAVEIAKKFSTAESGKFVNGILDKLKSERPA